MEILYNEIKNKFKLDYYLLNYKTILFCVFPLSIVLQANRWCARGIDLLASQHIEKWSSSPELAEQSLAEIQQYIASAEEFKLSSPKEFRNIFEDSITPETKALVTQVRAMCFLTFFCRLNIAFKVTDMLNLMFQSFYNNLY